MAYVSYQSNQDHARLIFERFFLSYQFDIPTPKGASCLKSVGFLLPKAKSISGIANVQAYGVPSLLP